MLSAVATPQTKAQHAASPDDRLMQKAKELETAFLAEILSFTGLGAASETMGGGAGEEQFASFLRTEQARLMVDQGGVGLAEMIFESLKAKEGGPDENP
jgi:Rod binding domain-containing protein